MTSQRRNKTQIQPGAAKIKKDFRIRYEEALNPSQLDAVTCTEGPLLVIAGAGSGKTRTLTYRVAYLVEKDISPASILLLTFTRKASQEMLRRATRLLDARCEKIAGGTFHSFANAMLRKYASQMGLDPAFGILDRTDAENLIGMLRKEMHPATKHRSFPRRKTLADIFSRAVNKGLAIEGIIDQDYPHFASHLAVITRIHNDFQVRKQDHHFLDYDDLLIYLRRLLSDYADIRNRISSMYQYIMVDEYQDTNTIQAEILYFLTDVIKNIMVVGDDSQSIYSFRGANFANILEFPKRYPDVRIYKLETNYRSVPEILNLANASIVNNQHQFQKTLRAIRESGMQPILVPFNDVMQQASFIAQRILELRDEEKSLNEMAVLYRAHYHSMELQMELTRRGIPFEVRSGLRFFEQAHIKDITSYLKVIVNPFEELAWKRITKLLPKIGNVTAHKIWNTLSSSAAPLKSMSSENIVNLIPKPSKNHWEKLTTSLNHLSTQDLLKEPAEMIRIILKEEYEEHLKSKYPDHESRMEDINQLMHFSQQYASTESFLSELALLSNVAAEDVVGGGYEDEKVKLSSIHQAKGLEWDIVFIIWLVEGRFPSMRSLNSPAGEEEERRLFYVAATRARDELYLGYPLWDYSNYNPSTLLKPSRFIQEIPSTSYTKWMVEEEVEEEW